MSQKQGRKIKLFFYSLFIIEAVIFTFLNYSQNMVQGEMTSFIIVEVSNLIFIALAFLGVSNGVDSLLEAFQELKDHPSVLNIYFYAQVFFLSILISMIALSYVFITQEMYLASVLLAAPGFMIFLFSTTLLSHITKGAMALHLVNNMSPSKSVITSIKLAPKYLILIFYSFLFKSSGLIAKKVRYVVLPSGLFPERIISKGADLLLSYATFYVAFGDSATMAVKKSIESSIDNKKETAFLNLGIQKVIILSSMFLILPIALFFAVFIFTWEQLGGYAVLLGAIPFLTGILAYLYLASAAAASGEIALLREIVQRNQ